MSYIISDKSRRYFLAGLVIFTIIFSFLMIRDFVSPLLISFVLAYIFYPFYDWMKTKTKMKNFSAIIISMVILLLAIFPVAFTVYNLAQEVNTGYTTIKSMIEDGNVVCDSGIICEWMQKGKGWVSEPEAQTYISNSIQELSITVRDRALGFVFSLPRRILDILLVFFFTFFILRDGRDIIKWIEKEMPMDKKHREDVFKQVKNVVHAVIYGLFLVAILEGVLIAITFWLADIGSPFVWGIISGLLALIPIVGASFIWIPALIVLLFQGNITAAIIVIVGGTIVGAIDTFWKPKIIGDKSKVHPILIVLGVFGGISLFGFIGVVIGPLILNLMFVFITMYRQSEKK